MTGGRRLTLSISPITNPTSISCSVVFMLSFFSFASPGIGAKDVTRGPTPTHHTAASAQPSLDCQPGTAATHPSHTSRRAACQGQCNFM